MPKNVLQDMVPPSGGRSIRNVPIPNGRKETPRITREIPSPKPKAPFKMPKLRMGGGKVWWWAGGLVGVVVIALIVMSFMSGARIEVVPKVVKVNISTVALSGYKADSVTGDKVPIGLPFQVVTVSKDGGKTVKTNGEEQVQRKANGTIVIFNNYGTASQRLIKNTRFESPEGLVYRIGDSVVVPAPKTVNGKKQAGSIEAVVYADDVGEKYNIGLTDFTIPGFKGDPRYKEMYARSKTPMAGGFVGTVKKVADEDKMVAENEIEATLRTDLLKSINSQIPSSMVVLSGLEKTIFTPKDQSDPSGNSVRLNTTGTITAVIADRVALSEFLSSQTNDLKNIPVTLSNADTVTFALKDGSKFDPSRDQTMLFNTKGDLVFIGKVINDDLIKALSGNSKTELQKIKDIFPGIDAMKVSLVPPWSSKMPTDAKDFKIIVSDPILK